jgi:hypothetical protein
MKLISLTIPEEESQLAPWLEEIFARGETYQLAEELSALREKSHADKPIERKYSLTDSYAEALPKVAKRGLGVLNEKDLKRLLRHPYLLRELVDFLFLEGGPYWDRLWQKEMDLGPSTHNSWKKFQSFLPMESGTSAAEQMVVSPLSEAILVSEAEIPIARRAKSHSRWGFAALSSFVTAAAVLIALVNIPQLRESLGIVPQVKNEVAIAPWGLLKEPPSGLDDAGVYQWTAAAFREALVRPAEDRLALATLINELRMGCSKLQLNPPASMSATKKADLLKRCFDWERKLDDLVVRLESKPEEFSTVKNNLNELIDRVSTVLDKEAQKMKPA